MGDTLVPAQTQEFRAGTEAQTVARGDVQVVGALSRPGIARLAERGVAPASAHLAVHDEDVLHAHCDSKTDRLPWDWYLRLAGAAVCLRHWRGGRKDRGAVGLPGVDAQFGRKGAP